MQQPAQTRPPGRPDMCVCNSPPSSPPAPRKVDHIDRAICSRGIGLTCRRLHSEARGPSTDATNTVSNKAGGPLARIDPGVMLRRL